MQAQKEAPADMQCKDKFLLQCVVASPGVTAKDVTPEMVYDLKHWFSHMAMVTLHCVLCFFLVINAAV